MRTPSSASASCRTTLGRADQGRKWLEQVAGDAREHRTRELSDPVGALGGKTPREAVRTPEGREAVIGLLKIYGEGEAHAALRESREPASFQFLWDAVGLDREIPT